VRSGFVGEADDAMAGIRIDPGLWRFLQQARVANPGMTVSAADRARARAAKGDVFAIIKALSESKMVVFV